MSELEDGTAEIGLAPEVYKALVTGTHALFEIVWNPHGPHNPTFQGPWLRNRKTKKLVRKLDEDEYIVR